MTRRRYSTRQRVALFAAHNGVCHICAGKIGPGEAWELEHRIPIAQGGEDGGDNIAPAHIKCHRAKTSKDAGDTAKAKRREARHIGAVAPSIAPIQSRGFPKARPQNKASRPIRKWFGWQESGGTPVAQDAGSIDCPPHGMEPASAHSARTR